jgi:hypothetical protein
MRMLCRGERFCGCGERHGTGIEKSFVLHRERTCPVGIPRGRPRASAAGLRRADSL